jgi:hypothetical protein
VNGFLGLLVGKLQTLYDDTYTLGDVWLRMGLNKSSQVEAINVRGIGL